MNIAILGAGMMGRAIAYDLRMYSEYDRIILADSDQNTRQSSQHFLRDKSVSIIPLDIQQSRDVKQVFQDVDVVISAAPYRFNYLLAKQAVETKTHFIDLGGNNTIVQQQRQLYLLAKKNNVTIIADSGLAPGLVSIITRDIVDEMDSVDSVLLRVGGLPRYPKPPLDYQIVFSPYGLINEYVEDAMVLDHGEIRYKQSLSEVESIKFPKPFGKMEAFLTSGGCSTLPYTYKNTIAYLDYKTIRYPGHCEKMKTLLDIGLAEETNIDIKGCLITPRDIFASLLLRHIPTEGEDVVLLKVIGNGKKQGINICREYVMIDYCDTKHDISAMMRTTGFPVSITAQMIEKGLIQKRGVFCPEEIVPPKPFFDELKKRDISILVRERRT